MIWVGVLVTTMCFQACNDSAKARDVQAKARTSPKMSEYLAPGNMHVGSPVFLRAIKEDKILELWVQPKGSGSFVLVKRYPVAAMSGNLGPKEKEGDNQVPEVFTRLFPLPSIRIASTIFPSISAIRTSMTVLWDAPVPTSWYTAATYRRDVSPSRMKVLRKCIRWWRKP